MTWLSRVVRLSCIDYCRQLRWCAFQPECASRLACALRRSPRDQQSMFVKTNRQKPSSNSTTCYGLYEMTKLYRAASPLDVSCPKALKTCGRYGSREGSCNNQMKEWSARGALSRPGSQWAMWARHPAYRGVPCTTGALVVSGKDVLGKLMLPRVPERF